MRGGEDINDWATVGGGLLYERKIRTGQASSSIDSQKENKEAEWQFKLHQISSLLVKWLQPQPLQPEASWGESRANTRLSYRKVKLTPMRITHYKPTNRLWKALFTKRKWQWLIPMSQMQSLWSVMWFVLGCECRGSANSNSIRASDTLKTSLGAES